MIPKHVIAPAELRICATQLGDQPVRIYSYPLEHPSQHPLTDSEVEVMRMLLAGRSNVEIARARGTARGTVAKQVAAVYRKLGVASRAELAAKHG